MAALIMLCAFASVAVGVAAVLLGAEERRDVRLALRSLDDYQLAANMREREMLRSLRERVLIPAAAAMNGLSTRFTPAGYAARTRRRLVLAGSPPGLDVDRFLALKGFGVVSIVLWMWFVFGFMGLGGFKGTVCALLLWGICFYGPEAYLNRRIEERQHLIATRLPDVLDLLVISVEAGLGFEQALDRTIDAVPGPLAEEFRRMLQETRVGSTRAEALRAIDERTDVPELRSFILAMLQADTFGVSIGRMLRAQADDMRIRRRQRAQETAQKAPVKMMIPLVFCIFPSIFVVILGPAGMQISRTL